jgi:hypothetical protein
MSNNTAIVLCGVSIAVGVATLLFMLIMLVADILPT